MKNLINFWNWIKRNSFIEERRICKTIRKDITSENLQSSLEKEIDDYGSVKDEVLEKGYYVTVYSTETYGPYESVREMSIDHGLVPGSVSNYIRERLPKYEIEGDIKYKYFKQIYQFKLVE